MASYLEPPRTEQSEKPGLESNQELLANQRQPGSKKDYPKRQL